MAGLALAQAPVFAPSPAPGQAILISVEEGELLVRAVEDVIGFANENPIEFHAYCPPDDWKPILDRVGSMTQAVERHRGAGPISIPRDGLLALFDLQECLIGARDEKLSAVKTTLVVSAGAAIAGTFLALPWLSIPAYLVSLGIIFGKPLLMQLRGDRPEPFKIGCPSLGDHSAKGKVIERVSVPQVPTGGRYWWGSVLDAGRGHPEMLCIGKGTFRVEIQAREGAVVDLARGWESLPSSECGQAQKTIAVWEPCGTPAPRGAPRRSGYAESFWVDYWGPATGGACRTAGPFG
jgi:hypothetical protein